MLSFSGFNFGELTVRNLLLEVIRIDDCRASLIRAHEQLIDQSTVGCMERLDGLRAIRDQVWMAFQQFAIPNPADRRAL